MKTMLLAGAAMLAVGPARTFADLNFDATSVDPATEFKPLPPGWYNVQIDESEMKPTTDGAGAYLKLRFTVLDGQYANRKIYTQLNLKNSNAQTVEIAQQQLSAICHAVGVLRPQKSEELHGIPMKGKIKIRPAQGDYEAKNDFTAYKNINEAVEMAGATPGGEVAAPAGFAGGAPASDAAPEQPWATPPAAGLEQAKAPEPAAQPWSQPPAADTPPAVPAAPAAPAAPHDPIAAAVADGWIQHPSSPTHHYRGQEVVLTTDLAAKYPAPAPAVPEVPAAPAVPSIPAAPTAPASPAANAGSADTTAGAPPWAQPKA